MIRLWLLLLLSAALCPYSATAASVSADEGLAYQKCLAEMPKATSGGYNVSKSACVPVTIQPYKKCFRQTYWVFERAGATSGNEIGPYERQEYCANLACSARPEQTGWKGGGDNGLGSVCRDGCKYDGSLYAGSPVGKLFTPTGGTCANGEFPAPSDADPGSGENGGGGGSETGGGNNGGGNNGGGNNGGGNNGGGNNGGGNNGGGNGNGDGDGDGDGDGNGNGNGNGGGTTPGDGSGGAPGPTTGRLYKKSDKTVAKVVKEFKKQIENAPILSKVKGFFGTCGGSGGNCPGEVWDGGQYAGHFDLSIVCGGVLLTLFGYAGWAFLAGISIVALRWALL